MCYMVRVGVRELRQQASVLLDQVAAGEVVEITNHGRLVARLVPARPAGSSRAELIAEGDLVPGRGSVLDVEPVRRPRGVPSTDVLLGELREER